MAAEVQPSTTVEPRAVGNAAVRTAALAGGPKPWLGFKFGGSLTGPSPGRRAQG